MFTYLVVYNICEIRAQNCDWYIQCIDNLLKLDHPAFHVAVSGCKVSNETKRRLVERYKNTVTFCFVEQFLSVNVTFNLTVEKCVSRYGKFTGYIYLDSGVNVDNNTNLLQLVSDRVATNKFSMITFQTDTDHGHHWFKADHVTNPYIKGADFIMPVGKCCNLHVQYFSHDLLSQFGRLIPDIFLAYCTESTLSFLNASIKQQWVIVKDVILRHVKEQDGATLSYDHVGPRRVPWNNLYACADMADIIHDPVAKQVGLGYEEIGNIMMHDPTKYNDQGHALDDNLKAYIKTKLFLAPDQLNYDHIINTFIPAK